MVLPASPATDAPAPPAKFDPKFDLLSGDDYISDPTSLALVPLGEQQQTTPLSEHNALVLFDACYDSNETIDAAETQPGNPRDETHASASHFQQHQNVQSPQGGLHLNGSGPGPGPSWNDQVSQLGQQQPLPLSLLHG